MNVSSFEKLLAQYDFAYPAESIAQLPASPRDAAKLLAYDRATGSISHDTFRHLADHLPPKSVLVLNRTKVIPARLTLTKPTGGEVRCLCVDAKEGVVRALCDHRVESGMRLSFKKTALFEVAGRDDKHALLRPLFPLAKLSELLARHGDMPLPPYIKHSPLSRASLKEKYQSVFARTPGSVAAPTASLHFTERLLRELQKKGHAIRFVTLHVGLGTFAPLTAEKVAAGKLHEERYDIDAATAAFLTKAKKAGRPIIPVGTTSLRALESAATAKGEVRPGAGATSLFIREGYRFKMADGLITNFHVPKSSLLMLASSLAGRGKLLALYALAVSKGYRLFSFGDGMLIR